MKLVRYEEFKEVNTLEEVYNFLKKHPNYKPAIQRAEELEKKRRVQNEHEESYFCPLREWDIPSLLKKEQGSHYGDFKYIHTDDEVRRRETRTLKSGQFVQRKKIISRFREQNLREQWEKEFLAETAAIPESDVLQADQSSEDLRESPQSVLRKELPVTPVDEARGGRLAHHLTRTERMKLTLVHAFVNKRNIFDDFAHKNVRISKFQRSTPIRGMEKRGPCYSHVVDVDEDEIAFYGK